MSWGNQVGAGSGFGAELRRLREDRGLSLAELAALTHYSKGYLSNLENARKPASPALARRLDTALGADGALLALAEAREEPACPYRGLAAFEPEDAEWFFGRARMTADLVGRVTDCVSGSLPLAVFGASGAGKSSLLRAGLVPAVARGALPAPGSAAWPVLVMTPTAHPVNALADSLAELLKVPAENVREDIAAGGLSAALRTALAGRRLLLIVDQFEEVFAVCDDEAERRAFITAVCDAARPGPDGIATAVVVLGIRADFYSRCLDHPELLRAAQDNQFAVGAMSREELVEAITAPALAARLALEPGLTELLLRDLGVAPGTGHHTTYDPGALPLLSHALLSTWQQRTDSHLTVAGYQLTGGIHGAVATTAERVYTRLDPPARQAARQLLLRLIRVGEDGTDTRRRVDRDRLVDQSGGRAPDIVEALAAARLLTLDDTTVEITHEALLRAWPRLRDWLAEDRQGLRALDQLAEAADAWEALQHDPGTLFRGTRLALVGEWAAVHRDALSEREERFLRASSAAEAAEQQATRRRTRRLRQLVGLLTVLLLIASVSVGYAMDAEHQAKKQRNIAVARRAAGEAAAMRGTNPALSLQLSLAAYRLAPTAETRDTLLGSFALPYASRLVGHTSDVFALAISPDGRTAITGSADRTARLWDITDDHRPRQLTVLEQAEEVKAVAFAPGGHVLATASGHTARLWDASDVRQRRELAVLSGHTDTVKALAFSPDGRTLATASSDHTVRLWNVTEPRRPRLLSTLTGHTSQLGTVVFSPDGRTLISASDATPRVWDVSDPRTPRTIAFLTGHTGGVGSAVFSPDGHTVATAAWDHTVRLWDLSRPDSPHPLATLTDHTAIVWAVAFSPDGRSLVSSGDGARLWDVSDPRRPVHMTTVPGFYAAAFTPDGHALVTTDVDHTARLVDLRELPLVGHGNVVPSVALNPRGHILATAGWDNTVRLWDVSDPRVRRPLATLTGHTNFVRSVAFSPDGRTLASASDDNTVRLWDVVDPRAPRTVKTLEPHASEVAAVAFSPDGRWLATGAYQQVNLWDVTTRDNPREVAGLDDFPQMMTWTVAFSPDSRTLGVASGRGVTARLWDIGDPRHPRELAYPFGRTDSVPPGAFSPDGRILATVSNDLDNDNLVRLVDINHLSAPRQLATITSHTGKIRAVAFSPDGRTLATAANDKTVRVWNIADPRHPKLLATLTGHTDSVTSVVFLPDGHTLATGSDDHTARLWDTSVDRVAARVCATVHPTITRAEWERYFPEITYRPPCAG
ncbi:helix-turn-helix domain-containing protein [Streptomyces noboritoensis]|uniref:Helix-turn-helix domain-containing protein n=1 Tax=Streptomyces noboritoensis TaxID=67337 RepID=A0ABV6TEB9_9ACTN